MSVPLSGVAGIGSQSVSVPLSGVAGIGSQSVSVPLSGVAGIVSQSLGVPLSGVAGIGSQWVYLYLVLQGLGVSQSVSECTSIWCCRDWRALSCLPGKPLL